MWSDAKVCGDDDMMVIMIIMTRMMIIIPPNIGGDKIKLTLGIVNPVAKRGQLHPTMSEMTSGMLKSIPTEGHINR